MKMLQVVYPHFFNLDHKITIFNLKLKKSPRNWAVDIYLPDCYRKLMEGLCGNFDGRKSDDNTGKDKNIYQSRAEWGKTWAREIKHTKKCLE